MIKTILFLQLSLAIYPTCLLPINSWIENTGLSYCERFSLTFKLIKTNLIFNLCDRITLFNAWYCCVNKNCKLCDGIHNLSPYCNIS